MRTLPLTALQAGMLSHHLREPESTIDVEQLIVTFRSRPHLGRLRAAWQAASDRHDALRIGFGWSGDVPVQHVYDRLEVPFVVEAHAAASECERRELVERVLCDERRRGGELFVAPLQRVRVLSFDAETVLIWTNHHAILDGRARALVLRDVAAAYAGRPLPAPGPSFAEHVQWATARDPSPSESWWRERLRGVTAPTPMPVAYGPRDASRSMPHIARRSLGTAATAALQRLGDASGATPTSILHAAWGLVLARAAGVDDVTFGAVRACRHSSIPDADRIVGLLINTLPQRVRIDDAMPVGAWVRDVHADWHALRAVEHTPLSEVARWSEVAAPSPLFDSIVVYEHAPVAHTVRSILDPHGDLALDDVRIIDRPNVALTLAASGREALELRLIGDPRGVGPDDVERVLTTLVTVLEGMPHANDVGDVPLLGDAERMRIVAGFNRSLPFPREATVPQLFAERAHRGPDRIAARLGDRSLRYDALAHDAAAIADALRARGVGRGSYVGVVVERSFAMLAAVLGTLNAGAAPIALDPAHPAERLAQMLRDGDVRIVLAQAHLNGALAAARAMLDLPPDVVAIEPEIAARPHPTHVLTAVGPDDPAHVVYTSGSTGVPKGVVLPHRAIVRTVIGTDYLEFGPDETFFGFVPLTFDVAVLELWGPLLHGGTLVLAPPGRPSLDDLGAAIERGHVTTLWLTTALFEEMVEEQLHRLRGVRQLIVGGDVMSPAHARRVITTYPQLRFLNVCGPSEATDLIVAHRITRPPDGPIPLGPPIANAPTYVLDARRRPLPIGMPGEIYTGGPGVGLGYLRRPELTAERFVPDPFATEPPAVMYRSGDLARWRPDGAIEFLGRIDTQVKVRGIRIELGEIEARLTDHDRVREAVVLCTGSGAADKQLVAYVVPRGEAPSSDALTRFLAERLPAAFVPSAFAFVDALPRTATGKFDRAALPDPATILAAQPRVVARPLTEAAELAVAGHVAEILRVSVESAGDSFHALGGDSLDAMRLAARLSDAFAVDVDVNDIYETPTIAGLTATIRRLERAPDLKRERIVALRATGDLPPIVFFHGDLAGGGYYCRRLAAEIDERHPVYTVAPHGTDGVLPPSVEAMARENALLIRRACGDGPIILGGFCNGAFVAYETARQLTRAHIAVERVVLVDALNVRAEPTPIRAAVRRGGVMLRRNAARLGNGHRRTPRGEIVAASWEAWHQRILDAYDEVLARYVAQPYGGQVSLVWTGEQRERARVLTERWRGIAPRLSIDTLPGGHLAAITQHLAETAVVLARNLA